MLTGKWGKHHPRKKEITWERRRSTASTGMDDVTLPSLSTTGGTLEKDCATCWLEVKSGVKVWSGRIWENLPEVGITMERNRRNKTLGLAETYISRAVPGGCGSDTSSRQTDVQRSERRVVVSMWARVGAYLSRIYHRPDTTVGAKGIVVSKAHFPPSNFPSLTCISWHEFGGLSK